MSSNPTFTQTGGARLDKFNASFPFATLSEEAQSLHLSCLGREYQLPRSSIVGLHRHRGLFSVGLRIEHTQDSVPRFIVFWASVFFWTTGFQKLRTELERLGYDVVS
jgi:hypothetical protein